MVGLSLIFLFLVNAASALTVEVPADLEPRALLTEAYDTAVPDQLVWAPERTGMLLAAACSGGLRAACVLESGWRANPNWTMLRREMVERCGLTDPAACRALAEIDCATSSACAPKVERWCERGDEDACALVSQHIRRVDRTRGTKARARDACGEESGLGCAVYGEILAAVRPEGKLDPAALEASARGCGLGSARACYQAAYYTSYLTSPADDPRDGAPYLQRACQGGLLEACAVYADVRRLDGFEAEASAMEADLCRSYAYGPACRPARRGENAAPGAR